MSEWDIQPGETSKAFHAFEHYRDLPIGDRSIDAAYREHRQSCEGHQRGTNRAPRRWKTWSVDNRWVDRAAAHDGDLSRRRRERRAAELREAQDRAAGIARSALYRLALRLENLNVDDIPAAVLDRWVKTLTEVELRALGHQDQVAVEHSGRDGGPIPVSLVDVAKELK